MMSSLKKNGSTYQNYEQDILKQFLEAIYEFVFVLGNVLHRYKNAITFLSTELTHYNQAIWVLCKHDYFRERT